MKLNSDIEQFTEQSTAIRREPNWIIKYLRFSFDK